MRAPLAFLTFLFLAIQSYAFSNEVVLGVLRQSTAERMSTGQRTPARPGFGLGLKTESYSYHGFTLKLGLMYEQRTVNDLFGGIENSLDLKTLDLITHLSYAVTDWFSIFAGPDYSVLLSSACKPVSGPCLMSEDAKKYFVPVVMGLDFTFLENYGAEIFFESISQEIWEKTFEKSQTYGLNLKYKF